MKLNHISCKNFMSFLELELSFDKLGTGIILVDGWNYDDSSASGTGKTSFLDIMSFGLFGESPRGIKVNEFVNDSTSKGCVVNVQMTMDNGQQLVIERTRKPEDLWYQIDDNTPVRDVDLRKTQKLLEDFLKLDFNTFLSSIYFSRSTAIKFISASNNEKMDILTRILDVSDFDKAYEITSDKLKELEDIKAKNLYEIDKLVSLKTSIEKDIQNEEYKSNQFEEDIKREVGRKLSVKDGETRGIQNNDDKITELKKDKEPVVIPEPAAPDLKDVIEPDYKIIDDQIIEIQARIDKAEVVKDKQVELQKLVYSIESKNHDYRKEIESIKNLGQGKCSRCKQIVTAEHLEQEVNTLNELIDQTAPILADHRDKLSKIGIILEAAKKLKKQQEDLRAQRTQLERDFNSLVSKTNKIKSDYNIAVERYKSAIQNQENEKEKINNKIDELQRDNTKRSENIKSLITEIEGVKARKNGHKDTIVIKQKDLQKLNKQVEAIEKLNADNEKEIDSLQTLKVNYKNIKYFIFETTVDELNSRINKYIEPLFNEDIKISYIYKSGKNNDKLKFDTVIEKNGVTKSYESLSDGEKKRAELATQFALSDIVSMRKANSLSLMILDEMFDGCPEEVRERIVQLLETLKQERDVIFIVDHFGAVKNIVENTIKIEKRDGVSSIVGG